MSFNIIYPENISMEGDNFKDVVKKFIKSNKKKRIDKVVLNNKYMQMEATIKYNNNKAHINLKQIMYGGENVKLLQSDRAVDSNNTTNTNPQYFIMNQNIPNNNQIFDVETNNHNVSRFKSTNIENYCLTSENNQINSGYSAIQCDDNNRQYFQIHHIAGENYTIQHLNNRNLCISSRPHNPYINSDICNSADPAQQFTIRREQSQYRWEVPPSNNIFINNDSPGHIRNELQNLILSFSNFQDEASWIGSSTVLSSAIGIASIGASEYTPNTRTQHTITHSAFWCPLIYNALAIYCNANGINIHIPQEWTISPAGYDPGRFNELSNRLSQIHGWGRYTIYILTEYHNEVALYNDFDENMFHEMRRIKGILGL